MLNSPPVASQWVQGRLLSFMVSPGRGRWCPRDVVWARWSAVLGRGGSYAPSGQDGSRESHRRVGRMSAPVVRPSRAPIMVQYLDVGDERPVSDIVPPCFAKIGVWMLPARPVSVNTSARTRQKAHIVYALTPLRGWFPACQAGFGFLAIFRSAINWAACRPSEGVVRNKVRNSEGGDALSAKEQAT